MTMLSLAKALNHHRAGRLAEAERLYVRFLAQHKGHEDARRLLAVVKHQTGRGQEALRDLDNLLAERPLFPEAMANRAVVLAALGRPDEAEAGFRQVLALAPGFPDAFGPLVRLLLAQDRLGEAGHLLSQTPSGWTIERASLAQKMGRPDQAEQLLRQALSHTPGNPELLAALVPVLTLMGCHQEAIEAGRAALALNAHLPGLSHNLSLTLLDSGHLKEGWVHFAHRWQAPGFPSHPRSLEAARWNGQADLSGKTVLVWREQGIGDEMIFASALPELIERAGQVIVECSAKLVPLFAHSFPQATIRAEDRLHDPKSPGIDVHLPMGDLFSYFRPRLDSFPARPRYLQADPAKRAFWRQRLDALGPGPKVGIAWKSTLVTPTRSHNFLPALDQMDALLKVPGVQFVNLQPRANKDEIDAARKRTDAAIHTFDDLDLFDDLDGQAALMMELDKVVSIGTATAILAAALGVPTGMFLLKHAQWDPMGTDAIPWLPAAKLFRRAWNESWDGSVEDAARWLGGSQQRTTAPQPLYVAPAQTTGAEALLDQATSAHLAGKRQQAEDLYKSVLAREPERVEALVNLAALQDEQGRLDEAATLLRTAYRLRPNEPAIPDNLGRLLIRQDRLEEAVPMLTAALKLEPHNASVMNDLGNALRLLGRLDESLRWLQKSIQLAPQMIQARFNLAKTLRELGRCPEALDQLKAIPNPDRFTLWEIGATCLQMGDLTNGWKGIEYRPGGLADQPLPDFRGQSVFVKAEQGVGDILYYASALPDLLAVARDVTLEAPTKLHALLARSFPSVALVKEGQTATSHKIRLPFGSLFHAFRPSLDRFTTSKPFLIADPGRVERWKEKLGDLGPGFKLGLAWRSTQVSRERARHFPGSPEKLDPLRNLKDVVAINLQAQARPDELRGLVSFADCDLFDDLDETAALISALDGVAVNGSAIGMLAAALGKPTALVMRADLHWVRLGTNGIPWLPAAKLFDCAWNETWEVAASRAADWIKSLPFRSNA